MHVITSIASMALPRTCNTHIMINRQHLRSTHGTCTLKLRPRLQPTTATRPTTEVTETWMLQWWSVDWSVLRTIALWPRFFSTLVAGHASPETSGPSRVLGHVQLSMFHCHRTFLPLIHVIGNQQCLNDRQPPSTLSICSNWLALIINSLMIGCHDITALTPHLSWRNATHPVPLRSMGFLRWKRCLPTCLQLPMIWSWFSNE